VVSVLAIGQRRGLLSYDATTAGGLMTSKPLIVTPDAPVAEVLARIRQPSRGVSEAAQVYVCEPPAATPTGRYLGTVGFQRLLREPPSFPVAQCIENSSFVRPDLPEREVTARLAAYYEADAFGRVSEAIARFLGTGRFLAGQTVVVVGWIALNSIAFVHHWDRDRATVERDREVAARTQNDTEYLARELAAVRLALADVVTTTELTDRLDHLEKLITQR
jgi:hypothetical protein